MRGLPGGPRLPLQLPSPIPTSTPGPLSSSPNFHPLLPHLYLLISHSFLLHLHLLILLSPPSIPSLPESLSHCFLQPSSPRPSPAQASFFSTLVVFCLLVLPLLPGAVGGWPATLQGGHHGAGVHLLLRRNLSVLGHQGLEEGEPGGRRQREMGTRRQAVETRMRWAGREGVRIRSGGAGGKGKEEAGP